MIFSAQPRERDFLECHWFRTADDIMPILGALRRHDIYNATIDTNYMTIEFSDQIVEGREERFILRFQSWLVFTSSGPAVYEDGTFHRQFDLDLGPPPKLGIMESANRVGSIEGGPSVRQKKRLMESLREKDQPECTTELGALPRAIGSSLKDVKGWRPSDETYEEFRAHVNGDWDKD